MQRSPLLTMLVLILTSTIVSGEVYRWVGADGEVHYGDHPPAGGANARSIELPPAPGMDDDHAERALKQQRLLDAYDAQRNEQERARAEAAAERQQRAQQCERAGRDLARFERANIIYRDDDNGGRVYLSDAARREAIAKARLWLGKHCN